MTLQNLLGTRQLQEHTPDQEAVQKLLASASRNLADARIVDVGTDNRFEMAYKCVMQCAMIGLWANGYRTSTNQPGHHQTAIQCLTLTMGVMKDDVIVLDGLRRQRNVTDYEGNPVSDVTLASCLEEAEKLLEHTRQWLRDTYPELMEGA